MRRSILFIVFASILSAFAVGCMPNTLPAVAFEPRVYPYVPGPGLSSTDSTVYNVQR
jgi:hypothetical protein